MLLCRTFLGSYADIGVIFPHHFMYPQAILFSGGVYLFVDIFPLLSPVVNLYIPVITLTTFTSTLIYTSNLHMYTMD